MVILVGLPILLDQASKNWALSHLIRGLARKWGPLMLTLVHNPGMMGGMLSSWPPVIRTVSISVLRIGADAAPRLSAGELRSVTGSALTYDDANLQAGGNSVLSPAIVLVMRCLPSLMSKMTCSGNAW